MSNKLPEIYPITQTSINWENFIRTVNELTGRSPTRLLDREGISVGDFRSFIAALGCLSENLSPQESLKYRDSLLNYLSFSFIIQLPEFDYQTLLRESHLNFLDNHSQADNSFIIITTGTLRQWKDSCIQFSNPTRSFELRYIADWLYLYFSNIGLAEIFFNIKRSSLPDQTFSLEYKF